MRTMRRLSSEKGKKKLNYSSLLQRPDSGLKVGAWKSAREEGRGGGGVQQLISDGKLQVAAMESFRLQRLER